VATADLERFSFMMTMLSTQSPCPLNVCCRRHCERARVPWSAKVEVVPRVAVVSALADHKKGVTSVDDPNIVSAIGTALSAIAAVVAVIMSWIVYRGQSRMTAQLAKDQTAISREIHQNQTLLSQRQLLIPLWGYMSGLDEVDPSKSPIIEPDVLKIVNTLELVSLCCEGGMIDKAVIKRTFKDVFMKLYDQVKVLPTLPGLKGIEAFWTRIAQPKPCCRKILQGT